VRLSVRRLRPDFNLLRVRGVLSPSSVTRLSGITRTQGVLTMKAPFIGAAIAAAAIGAAPLASADQVPNMNNNAVLGQACATPTGRFVFGQDTSGTVLVCGAPGQPHVWVAAGNPLVGVRQIGDSGCVEEIHSLATSGAWAQSPDGVALICAYPTDTWEVRPNPS
jgi:hypothetical protein